VLTARPIRTAERCQRRFVHPFHEPSTRSAFRYRPEAFHSVAFRPRAVERTPHTKAPANSGRQPIAHSQISVVIDGRSIVEAHTKPRLPPDFSNAPLTRAYLPVEQRETYERPET
jgi:hypothetical protein